MMMLMLSLSRAQIPLVKLDDAHYKLVDQMEALVEAPPSLLHATSLTVKGAVKFAAGVVIDGDVTLEAEANPAVLTAGKYESGVHKVGASPVPQKVAVPV